MARGKTAWSTAFAEAGCFSFLEATAERTVGRALARCPEVAPLVGERARKDLQNLCLMRLAAVYERPLTHIAMQRAGIAEFLPLGTGGETGAKAKRVAAERVRDELGDDGVARLCERLPFAPAYEQAITCNFAEAAAEFLDRFARCRSEVSETLLGGKAIRRIEGFPAQEADPHRHGRMVLRVDTDAGTVFYKPRDCQSDVLFRELSDELLPGCVRTAKLILGDGFAFVEQLSPEEPAGENGLRAYWQNLGRLTALFRALGSQDMTHANIMCCGERPAVLDLETLLVGEMMPKEDRAATETVLSDMTARRLADSVACTAILPLHVSKEPTSPLVADNPSGTCLPRAGGVPITVKGFEEDYLTGFGEGYHHLASRRESILELLGQHGDVVCRQLLLNTGAYVRARTLLFSPQALSDSVRRDEVLAELNCGYSEFSEELRQAVAETDAAALMEGDLPYHFSRAGSRMLFGGDGRALGEFLDKSALEAAATRLSRFSEEELRFELDLIGRCLAAAGACSDSGD